MITSRNTKETDPLAGRRQAADYADRIHEQTGVDLFIFLTDGDVIYFWNRNRYAPRQVI